MALPSTLSMGAVTLRVSDMDKVVAFYRDGVGLAVLADSGNSVVLGRDWAAALIVEHEPQLRHASDNEAGLFHSAFLFDTQAELASAVASLAQKYPTSFTGSADHLVSEAFYFDDPEGNGVELYFDRARTEWSWADGHIAMDTLPLDPNAYLATHFGGAAAQPSTIGHVHLSVGSIDQAHDFYVNTLGFNMTLNWGGTALFVSAGGYHHHMAMNVWRSRGAGRRQPTLGLGEVAIELDSKEDVASLAERLADHDLAPRDDGASISVEDPWGNVVTVSSRN
jgi:catechol 2,3-dioxygenase